MKLSCRLMADERVGSEREQPHSQPPVPRVGRTEHDAHVGLDCNELATTLGSPLGSCRHAALPELADAYRAVLVRGEPHRVDERCVCCLHVFPGCRENAIAEREFIDVPRNDSHRSCRGTSMRSGGVELGAEAVGGVLRGLAREVLADIGEAVAPGRPQG